jgi:hypothetical protein
MNTKTKFHGRSDGADAFLPDPFGRGTDRALTGDEPLADVLGKSFVSAVTSGEEMAEDIRDELTTEELGGPFVITRARDEFAADDDTPVAEANREAFPTSSAALTR